MTAPLAAKIVHYGFLQDDACACAARSMDRRTDLGEVSCLACHRALLRDAVKGGAPESGPAHLVALSVRIGEHHAVALERLARMHGAPSAEAYLSGLLEKLLPSREAQLL